MDANKQKSLDLAMKQIDKAFGKGALMRLGDKTIEPIKSISTGSIGLDLALGIGGVPQGRVVEIYGPESSGKTTLALQITAECQKEGGVCAFIDAEHALDVIYAKNLGVDTDNLLVSQPDYGEQALDIVETIARSGAIDLIVIDEVSMVSDTLFDMIALRIKQAEFSGVILIVGDFLQLPPVVKGFEERLTAFVMLDMKNTNCNLIELAEKK